MSDTDYPRIQEFAKFSIDAGWEWCGVQLGIPPQPSMMVIRKGNITRYVPSEPDDFDPEKLAKAYCTTQEKKMTLLEKLHSVYHSLDAVEKSGHNKSQNYDYIRAADVTHAIRKQLIALKVYAEINFDFVGGPFTIAREKAPNAPFSAVLVKCSIVYWDLESGETKSASGLGTGADTGDKAAYKAMTGSLKYALKNSFMVADEADPEADENVDEGARSYRDAEPDFQDAKRGRDTQKEEPRQQKQADRPTDRAAQQDTRPAAALTGFSQPAQSTETPASNGAKHADAQSKTENASAAAPEQGDAFEGPDDDSRMPTEAELDVYRKKFSTLGNDLADKGKLKASKGLPAPVKLKTFLLSITKADSPKTITVTQWDDFFGRVDKAVALETGFIGLAKLINKASGIEDKQ